MGLRFQHIFKRLSFALPFGSIDEALELFLPT